MSKKQQLLLIISSFMLGQSHSPIITQTGSLYSIQMYRDFDRVCEDEKQEVRRITQEIQRDNIISMTIYTVPFGWMGMMRHTMIGFVMDDGTEHVFSLEMLYHPGEIWSIYGSMTDTHALIALRGSAHDMLGLRILRGEAYTQHIYTDPLLAQATFHQLAIYTHDIQTQKPDYHPRSANCRSAVRDGLSPIRCVSDFHPFWFIGYPLPSCHLPPDFSPSCISS